MLEYAHALTGAAIAVKVQNPALALPLALISHFVIDYFPHWNFNLGKEIKKRGRLSAATIGWLFADSGLGLFLGLALATTAWPNIERVIVIIMAAFLAVLPDLVEAPFFLFKFQNKYIKKLLDFQQSHQWNVSFWPGIIVQAVYALIILKWVFPLFG